MFTINFRTYFGPYEGKLEEDADKCEGEGYVWEIKDSNLKSVIGFVDPGSSPDYTKQWLAYVNCPVAQGIEG